MPEKEVHLEWLAHFFPRMHSKCQHVAIYIHYLGTIALHLSFSPPFLATNRATLDLTAIWYLKLERAHGKHAAFQPPPNRQHPIWMGRSCTPQGWFTTPNCLACILNLQIFHFHLSFVQSFQMRGPHRIFRKFLHVWFDSAFQSCQQCFAGTTWARCNQVWLIYIYIYI